ncbi:putative serine threonine- kinase kinX [Labeo rohita]|uniref:Putative serine threonine-kinase kinX n=1 Tax=Labeo rohita TaxID=84645 RepID=A0A498MNS0_LABRO|nr:putative serine threonine- kinase kinX [Labeo rohita]
MDPPENSVNRIGRTIWTVWGYLSGAVARYLRPEVTEDGNQIVRSKADDIDLKTATKKIDREVKANNSDLEGKKTQQNDSTEVKRSPSRVRAQAASAQWENTDVVTDDNSDKLRVDTTKKQPYHRAMWSTGTHTDDERRTGDGHAEKEAVSSDEDEKENANCECEERETAQELEEPEKTEQKHGDNKEKEESDQNLEDEKCAKRREDADNTDLTVQSEQDVEREKQMNVTDHGETERIAGFKHEDEHLFGEKEKTVDQKDQEKAGNDEAQGLDSQDLLPQMKPFTEEADGFSKLERQEVKYSDEIADVFKNEVEEMTSETGSATEQDKERATELEESGQLEPKDGDSEVEECDRNHEDEKCDVTREDLDNAEVMVQSELHGRDVKQEKHMSFMHHAETEDGGGFNRADEHPIDEKENEEMTENDEDQRAESLAQDLLPQMEYFTEEAGGLSELERQDVITKYSDEIADVSKNEVEEMTPETGGANEQEKESATELEESGQLGQKDDDNENDEDQGTESLEQDLLPQMEYFTAESDDLAKPERLKLMEKYSDEIDEFSKKGVEEMMLGTELDEDTTESEQDVTKYELTESVETLQRVYESLSEKNAPNDEPELKMTTVDETVDALEDTLLSDSKRDTSEYTPETGTGSPAVAVKTEVMFSDLTVCEFPGDLKKGPETALAETDLGCFEEIKTNPHDPQTPAEERPEREAVVTCSVEHLETLKAFQTEQDTETVIESSGATENQEIDKTEASLKEHAEFRTELIVETIETKISSEDEEAETFETESRTPIVRNVTLQLHELLEFTEGQCKSSQGTMDPFNEAQGNSSVSEIAGTAEIEHVSEDQTDVEPVSTRSLRTAEFLEDTLDLPGESERCTEEQEILETDVAKTALEYVEEITNQVWKEMTETECNVVQKTELLVGLSTEEPGDAEYQGAAQCVAADAFVLEEDRKLLAETMDSRGEMETASSEVVKQNEQHVSSPECETAEADEQSHERIQKSMDGETVSSSREDWMEVSRPGMKRGFDQVSKDLPELKKGGKFDLYLQAFEDSCLDFTFQKARIAVKNPLVRPPKDPRKLLFKASLEPPLPQPSAHAQKVSAPSKGVIGFKLPGLGAGLPVLRKTEFGQKAREGGEAEKTLQPQQTSVAVTEDSVKQEQVPAKAKWTPPKHPGMGSPFMMAELKSKLKKPVQE